MKTQVTNFIKKHIEHRCKLVMRVQGVEDGFHLSTICLHLGRGFWFNKATTLGELLKQVLLGS